MTRLERMQRDAVILDRPSLRDDPGLLDWVRRDQMRRWGDISRAIRESGDPTMAGETTNYHETRNPYKQTADYGTITLTTTSLSILPISTVLVGSSLQFLAPGYWDLGKKIRVRMFCKVTTVLTPGNFTFEIRYDTGAPPTDAGGTILATSAATAFTASKTNLPLEIDFSVEARAVIGTTAALFAKGKVISDGAGALITSPNNPIFMPASAPASVNVDTTKASTIHVDVKRSGSTVETITVHDFQVDALT